MAETGTEGKTAQCLNSRQARWPLFFSRLQFSLHYLSGDKNKKENALSRSMMSPEEESEEPRLILSSQSFHTVSPVTLDQIPQGKTYVPPERQNDILSWAHSSKIGGHFGAFLQAVSMTSVKSAIEESLKNNTISINKNYGSVIVEIWDGHYVDDEPPSLPISNDLLTVSNIKKFLATQISKKGKEMSMIIIESLSKKERKLKRNSQEYQQHQRFYEEAMGEKFYDLIELALLNAGYGPL
ncbi:uncharacterized protein LOC142292410 [Anomaloglossus baeobatrachus]|uniref:uncharacterized protein LOC142292410 n=1 Tax=Anomaloglossus baeobatrachus TaxID=238106 RepID=UPI003F502B67